MKMMTTNDDNGDNSNDDNSDGDDDDYDLDDDGFESREGGNDGEKQLTAVSLQI